MIAAKQNDAPGGPRPIDGVQIVISDTGGVASPEVMQNQSRNSWSLAAHDFYEDAQCGHIDVMVLGWNRNSQLNIAGAGLHVALKVSRFGLLLIRAWMPVSRMMITWQR